MKKLIVLAMTMAMALSVLAGCGTKENAEESVDSAQAVEESGDAEAESTSSGDKLVFWNLSFWSVDENGEIPTEELVLNKAVAEFEAEFGVEVEVVNQTEDQISELFKSAGLAQNGPDVALMWAGSATNDFAEYLEPLDDYFTEEELSAFPDLTMCKEGFKEDGALLGIPTESNAYSIFYNKDAFAAAGLPEDVQFETLDELYDACAKLKAAGITPFALVDSNGYNSAWGYCELSADKLGTAGVYELRTGEKTMDGEIMTAAMEEWVEFGQTLLENEWCNADAFTSAGEDVYMEVYTGESAMRIGGSWNIGDMTAELGDRAGAMQFPAASADDPYADYITSQFNENLIVTNYSKNKELAVEFVKILASAEAQMLRYEQEQRLPARIDISLEESAVQNELANTFYGWIANNKNVVGFDAIISLASAEEFYRLTPQMITGDMSIEDGMAAIQAENNVVE